MSSIPFLPRRLKDSLAEAMATRDEKAGRSQALFDAESPAEATVKLLDAIIAGNDVRTDRLIDHNDWPMMTDL